MSAHAYLCTGTSDERAAQVASFVAARTPAPDIEQHTAVVLTIDDVRALQLRAIQSARTEAGKVVVLMTERIFTPAQNALLKLLEEPPPSVIFIMAVPRPGILLPTVLSRLVPLPAQSVAEAPYAYAASFIAGSDSEREKMVGKIVERARADQDQVKQQARADAAALVEGLIALLHKNQHQYAPHEYRACMEDAHTFLATLHSSSAPLKPMLEHLRLVFPTAKAPV
jgi:DNA polymerase III delta prime subunit